MTTMITFSGSTFRLFSQRVATGEGSLIAGTNPVAFTIADPLRLWIIQASIIIIMVQLLSLGLRRIKQPKVIAEVLAGVLLGPTALGMIPGFTESIFPDVSIPYLTLVADIGLCLFLFLVGLEIDTSVVMRNARMSVIVSLAGIALPFGLGTALSVPLYQHFIDPSVPFTDFMLFTGVAYSITAFPVLCRILTELSLLDTHVGIIVLSAGVGNDVIGWTLLALSVALVNAGSGLIALYTLLVCIAFSIFLLFPVKFAMLWLARKTGSTENGPTMFYMTAVILLLWASAFFTDAIGVNAIFGAFLAGLVVPREGGLAITLTEKLEDVVSIVFLPLYFTLSGLNTNLGLLDDGITWLFTIAIIVLSFSGKFGGCMIASRLAGRSWRESSTIGALMSCKGLVELIVLNVGLQAGILSQRVFSMFVLEALTLTFITTPLVTMLYPPERRVRVGETGPTMEGDARRQHDDEASIMITEEQPWRHRFTVVLDKLDHIPAAMALTQLVLPPRVPLLDAMSATTKTDTIDKMKFKIPDVRVDALQLIERSHRTAMMSVTDGLIHTDPVLSIFRMFGELNELAVTTSLSVIPHDEFAHNVAEHAQKHASHFILLPWLPPTGSTVVDTSDLGAGGAGGGGTPKVTKSDHNPFDVIFGNTSGNRSDQFVRGVFAQSKIDVALFIDTGDRSGAHIGGSMHVFLPFFGGPDDRLALDFVVQLCLNPKMTATVVRMVKREGAVDVGLGVGEGLERPSAVHFEHKLDVGRLGGTPRGDGLTVTSLTSCPDTVYGRPTTEMRLQCKTADELAWSKYVAPTDATNANNRALRYALARIHFSDAHTPVPVQASLRHARALRETSPRVLIVAGRSRRLAKESHHGEMKLVSETYRPGVRLEGMRKTIGDVGTAMVVGGSASAVVVVQAANVASS
ncbi:Sodium/hydrogen exchanger family-domain-containing protein [Boletus coccyginus]|nr:Sodium/hydrogen exchanger family-domain-containing protein [Boletus coccyginus]